MIDKHKIGGRIRNHRKDLGLTQKKLGEMVGVTKQAICNYETGDCLPGDNIKIRMAEALQTTIFELFFE